MTNVCCVLKKAAIYLKACEVPLLSEPHRLTINDAFADKWLSLCRLANETRHDGWRQTNAQLSNVPLYYNLFKTNQINKKTFPCAPVGILNKFWLVLLCSLFFLPSFPPPSSDIAFFPSLSGQKGQWLSGFFDNGSFLEIMQPWAQTVVVGRAR